MKPIKGRGKRWDKLIDSIKADAAKGVVTLITLSVKDMEDTARRLTVAELRNVRFTFFGMSLQRLALDAPKSAEGAAR
jgi:hypothetical protein